MKNLFAFTFSICIILLINSCGIKGEGEPVRSKRASSSFDALELNINATVVLIPGQQTDIVIEAQPNITDLITTNVEENTLVIDFDKTPKNYENITIYITAPTFRDLSINGSGSMETQGEINSTDMEAGISGSGQAKIEVKCNSVKADISGSGKLKISGFAQTAVFDISGSGNVDASEFNVNSAEVDVDGSGSAVVNAKKDLKASVSGSGAINYLGNPNVKSDVSGSGKIAPQQ